MNANLKVTGIYDESTLKFVQAFQIKYSNDILKPWGETRATKFAYYTTIMKINNLMCEELRLKVEEKKLIPISNRIKK